MNFTLDLNTLLQAIAIFLIIGGIKGIFSINAKVSTICTRLGKIETWQTGHEKIDDERHAEAKTGLASVWERLNQIAK